MKASLTIQITSSSPPKYLFLFLLYNISSLPSFPFPSNFFSFSTKFPFLFHQISPASPPIFCPSIFSPCTWSCYELNFKCCSTPLWAWHYYKNIDLRFVLPCLWFKICATFCLVSYIFLRILIEDMCYFSLAPVTPMLTGE